MKLTFTENDYETSINLTPETPGDVAQLIRMTKNSKAVKPELYLSFSSNEPWAVISIKKLRTGSNKVIGAMSNNT